MNQQESSSRSDAAVIIPMYNERENAAAIIDAVLALDHPFDVLVIDDNSPDGTAEIVRAKMTEHPGRVHLIERKGKLGLGTAYITGFKWCLAQGYEYICEMDADFSHNPADLLRLYNATACEGADVAIGSRYVTGVNVVNWPMGRVLMSYYASKYVRMITRMPVHDTTAGFVCYRRRVLEALPLDKIKFKGYAFQIEMKFTAYKFGFRITEIPIIFVNRVLGTSKMSSGIFGEAVFGVVRLKWNSFFKKFPDFSSQ
ncbi:MAG: polyprenol monophosphomannose synthase [Odoribacter sp.]|nr:polyprenol monophosphomannose synthase [Odoribacter sp.]